MNTSRWTILTIVIFLLLLIIACGTGFAGLMHSPARSNAAALLDADGDGDLDAFLANGRNEDQVENTLWINQGGAQQGKPGTFRLSSQRPGKAEFHYIAAGDMDGDGDQDVMVTSIEGVHPYENTGSEFREISSPDRAGEYWSGHIPVSLGDLDGDGDLDAFTGQCCGGYMFDSSNNPSHALPPYPAAWFNQIGENSQRPYFNPVLLTEMGSIGAQAVALGDLDGDSDLDALIGTSFEQSEDINVTLHDLPDRVWWNDGRGKFSDSGQALGASEARAVALGDLDGDGDLDALVAAEDSLEIWQNQGGAQSGPTGRMLLLDEKKKPDSGFPQALFLVDIDSDDDLDVLLDMRTRTNAYAQFFRNDGSGKLKYAQRLPHPQQAAIAAGDLDDDGDIDLLVGLLDRAVYVWKNDGTGMFMK